MHTCFVSYMSLYLYRSVVDSGKAAGMTTDVNPAYGLCNSYENQMQGTEDSQIVYEMPH